MTRNVKGLCFGDGGRTQIFFHKEPKYLTAFTTRRSSSSPPFFESNLPHRLAPFGNVSKEYCWSYFQENLWPLGHYGPMPCFVVSNCTAPFLVFLIRNAGDRLEYLHIGASRMDDVRTMNYLLFILMHVFAHCKKLKSLQCGAKFLRLAALYKEVHRDRSYSDMLLDNISYLEEIILTEDSDQPTDIPFMFLETLMLKCSNIRRLVVENVEVGDDIVFSQIGQMTLERLDFRIRSDQTYSPILFNCFLSSFRKLKEVKLSVPLHQSYLCYFQTAMEFLRATLQLEKFSIGYQLKDQACIHGGEVAYILNKGFRSLKYLELCSMNFVELTDVTYTCKGMFLQNVACTLEYLHIGQLYYELFSTISSVDCCGDLTRTIARPLVKLRHLRIECRSIKRRCCLIDFIDRFCPALMFLEFVDYDYVNFISLARKIYDRLHSDKKCEHKKLDGQCHRRFKIMSPTSLCLDVPDAIANFKSECCLTLARDNQRDMYIAKISRCCPKLY